LTKVLMEVRPVPLGLVLAEEAGVARSTKRLDVLAEVAAGVATQLLAARLVRPGREMPAALATTLVLRTLELEAAEPMLLAEPEEPAVVLEATV